jgi:hypothetical protein
VSFLDCLFQKNRYAGTPAQPAVIVGNGRQNRIIVDRTKFQGNDMIFNNSDPSGNSMLIETSGPITVTGSCFVQNSIGFAPIVTYGAGESIFVDNLVGNVTLNSRCQLAAQFVTETEFLAGSPQCESATSDKCIADGTKAPSAAPTEFPTPAPTSMPTTLLPTALASEAPTAEPTEARETPPPVDTTNSGGEQPSGSGEEQPSSSGGQQPTTPSDITVDRASSALAYGRVMATAVGMASILFITLI